MSTTTATTVLADWLEGELAVTRAVLERAVARSEALAGLLAFVRDAEADLGQPVTPDALEAAAVKVGGERRRAEVAALVDQMGDPLHLA
ncbi:hypothetical protein [Nocardioides pakistanensis]